MMTDPISDFLTQIRNASKAKLPKVDVQASQMKLALVEILKTDGFVKNYRLFQQGNKAVLRVYLKYVGKNRPVIRGMKRISKPSRRVYAGYNDIPKVLGGLGLAIVSTSRGMLTDRVARENKVGGEVVCTVW